MVLLGAASRAGLIDGEELKYDKKSLLKFRQKVGIVFQNPDAKEKEPKAEKKPAAKKAPAKTTKKAPEKKNK